MSGIDWSAALAELLAERAALDVLIEGVRRRLNGTVSTALTTPVPPPTPAPRAAPPRHGRTKLTEAQLGTMRKLFEQGAPAAEISKRAKVSEATIYKRASADGWKRPKPEKPPQGEQLKGSTRCNWCQTMTDYDPCRSCGKKLKRNW